jgi:hypothetical protein
VYLTFVGSSPGECWAFRGSEGSVVINLSSGIYVKAVTLEHIPATLAPDGVISSAPKDFQVFGLTSLTDENPVNLVSQKSINFFHQKSLGSSSSLNGNQETRKLVICSETITKVSPIRVEINILLTKCEKR